MPTPVIAIFDVGKTNKKVFLFNEAYQIVYEQSAAFPETVDEDGFPCDDISLLTTWVTETFRQVLALPEFEVRAVNFTSYGASFVFVDTDGQPVAPLYNYLKPYPHDLKNRFYATYGGEEAFSLATASPVLDSLNSGMQLYRFKQEQPQKFSRVVHALHLPQYLSALINGHFVTDITSIGCHTNMWDFNKHHYHQWIEQEQFSNILPAIATCDTVYDCTAAPGIPCGIGLHDSSAALIPYLVKVDGPFVLLSTGTWCISLNPFNATELTADELKQDCLAYLQYDGKPVKASRLFAGQEHEDETKRVAAHFGLSADWYRNIAFQPELIVLLEQRVGKEPAAENDRIIVQSLFAQRDISLFNSSDEAYHQLMVDIVARQTVSTQLVLKGAPVEHLYVDGGFSKNPIYMHLLAKAFPHLQVYAASVAQATALGAALVIHQAWNKHPIPEDLVEKVRV